MKRILPGALLILFLAILFISGCGKTSTPTDPIVYDNMSDNVTTNDNVEVNDSIVNESTVILTNDTVIFNETIDNSTLINESMNNQVSVYSEYSDTSLIDESINDVESLN